MGAIDIMDETDWKDDMDKPAIDRIAKEDYLKLGFACVWDKFHAYYPLSIAPIVKNGIVHSVAVVYPADKPVWYLSRLTSRIDSRLRLGVRC